MIDRRRGRLAIPPVLAALAASLAFLPAWASAAECPADKCFEFTTSPNGVYVLTIPARGIALIPGGSGLADCKWSVKAEFGDGSEPEELEFDASKAFTSSHTFPAPGVYIVDIYATEGIHAGSSTACPDLHIQAKVTYPEPVPEESEEPAPEGPGAQAPGGGGGAAAATQAPAGAAAPAPPPGSPYWKACGGVARAHLVACRKAKRVIRAARSLLSRARLEQGASFKAAGFGCRLRGNGDLACQRGKQRVLGA
jgi:hypothetical protein